MSRRLGLLPALLIALPAFGAPMEAARVEVAPVLSAPSVSLGAMPRATLMTSASVPVLAAMTSVSAPAAALPATVPSLAASPAAYHARAAVPSAPKTPVAAAAAQILSYPSARTQAGVAARVEQAAKAWGAPIEKIFDAHDVLVYGENHGSLESVETLTREMPRLAKAGVKAIGIEGLKRPHQHDVDAYLAGRLTKPPFAALDFSPRRMTAFENLLVAARKSGVRVVALGLPLDYWSQEAARTAAANTGRPASEFAGSASVQFQRAQSGYEPGFNEAVAQVYLTERNRTMADFLAQALGTGGKAVVLVGQAHVDGLDMIPGKLLNAPGQWGTLAEELTKRALRAFSLTQTGGKFVDEDDAENDRRARPLSYRTADAAAQPGRPAFIPLGSDRGLWHAGDFDHSTVP